MQNLLSAFKERYHPEMVGTEWRGTTYGIEKCGRYSEFTVRRGYPWDDENRVKVEITKKQQAKSPRSHFPRATVKPKVRESLIEYSIAAQTNKRKLYFHKTDY